MNGQQLAPMTVGFAIAVVLILVIGFFRRKRNMIAHLAPVKRELKKEKQWLRRGEYNAAMVKGRQNLELFLKLVAEFNGIELDNSAQAMANARSSSDGRGQRETYRMNGRKRQRVMTFQQFGWWLDENAKIVLTNGESSKLTLKCYYPGKLTGGETCKIKVNGRQMDDLVFTDNTMYYEIPAAPYQRFTLEFSCNFYVKGAQEHRGEENLAMVVKVVDQ